MPHAFVLLSPDEYAGLQARLTLLETKEATMLAAVEKLVREVAEQRTVTESVLTFLAGLKAQLATVQAELTQLGAASETLNALADDLDTQQQALAAAIATTPPVEDPVDPPEAT